MDVNSVPAHFSRYAKVVERLKVNEMVILDESKFFNKMDVDELVKPKKFAVKWSGELKKETEVKRTEMDEWKKRFAIVTMALNKMGVTYEQLALLSGYKSKAGVQQLVKKKLNDEDLKKIQIVLQNISD